MSPPVLIPHHRPDRRGTHSQRPCANPCTGGVLYHVMEGRRPSMSSFLHTGATFAHKRYENWQKLRQNWSGVSTSITRWWSARRRIRSAAYPDSIPHIHARTKPRCGQPQPRPYPSQSSYRLKDLEDHGRATSFIAYGTRGRLTARESRLMSGLSPVRISHQTRLHRSPNATLSLTKLW